MNLEKMIIELKENGFKVIEKETELRLIKNKKAMNYNKEKFEAMEINAKRNELNAIIKAFL